MCRGAGNAAGDSQGCCRRGKRRRWRRWRCGELHQAVDAEGFRRLRRWALSLSSVAASLALVTTLWAYQKEGAVQPAATWEQVALSPEVTRVDDTGATSTEDVAMAQWVLADLAAGGADHD